MGGWKGGKNDLLEILVAVTEYSPLDLTCSASCGLGGDGSHLGAATITVTSVVFYLTACLSCL